MSEIETKTPSLKSQGAWLMFARTVGIAFSFLLPVIVVRILSQEDFGIYKQVFRVLMNAVTILSLGFAMSAYYFLSREKEKRPSAILNILLFHFVIGGLACILLFLYPEFLVRLTKSPQMAFLAPLIGITIWIWLFSIFIETVAVANKESRPSTFFIIFSQVSKTVFIVGAVVAFGTIESILYAAIIQGSIQTLILLIYLNSRFPRFWTTFGFRFFGEHLVYAIPFGLAATLWILQQDIHQYFAMYKFSDAEFAIYAAGCAQLPFAAILIDSIGAVLIPRMTELQQRNDKREMIRVTARAMQKLAFFFFPIFIFLLLTSETFVSTLYTRNYLAAVPIFIVNIALFPFFILISDPVMRAYKELGRFLLYLRVFIFIGLVAILYYGLDHFGMVGIIAAAVAAIALEILVAEAMLIYKLKAKFRDLFLLKNVLKTAIISIAVGAVTYLVYYNIKGPLAGFGESIVTAAFNSPKIGIIDFVSGVLTLGISFGIFAPLYLLASSVWNVIDDDEKRVIEKIFDKLLVIFRLRNPQKSTPN